MSNETASLDYLLAKASITKIDLARRLGVSRNTVTSWKVLCPQYAIAYLQLLIDYNKVRP